MAAARTDFTPGPDSQVRPEPIICSKVRTPPKCELSSANFNTADRRDLGTT